MLAILRVALLLPSPTLRAVARGMPVGTGKQAHRSNWKASSARRYLAIAVMHFYCGEPMHLLSGVDTRANARKSAVRAAVEHVFARQKGFHAVSTAGSETIWRI